MSFDGFMKERTEIKMWGWKDRTEGRALALQALGTIPSTVEGFPKLSRSNP